MLVLFLENRIFEQTGGQPFSERVDFDTFARGAGIEGGGATGKGKIERIETIEDFTEALPRLLTEEGPHFVICPVENHEHVPPPTTPTTPDASGTCGRDWGLRRGVKAGHGRIQLKPNGFFGTPGAPLHHEHDFPQKLPAQDQFLRLLA